ncbi:MAG: DUF58 domain-containing protein [Capsulimonadaceae bacterium]
MPTTQKLLDPDFVKKIEALNLVTKRAFLGQAKGDRRSRKRGTSIEFADYREYTMGDDLRYVDWRAYARLDKLFLKLFIEEEDLNLHLLLDSSRSMDYGEPMTKADYARRLAAALGYIALSEHDRVVVAPFKTALGEIMPPQRGKPGIIPFFRYLEEKIPASGGTNMGDALSRYAAQVKTPGIAVVMSDFFDESHMRGIKALLSRKMQVFLVHIFAPEELKPTLTGDLKLVDSETDETCDVSVSPHLMAQYDAQLKAFISGLHQTASRYGMDYLQTSTDVPVETIVLQSMRRMSLVK